MATIPNGNSLPAYSDAETVAATGLTAIREMFPSQHAESDAAVKLRVELLAEVVAAVGPDRFLRAVKDAISVSKSRWDCSVAKIRECAGLRYEPPQSRTAAMWDLVTQVFLNHVRMDPEGRYRLEEKIVLRDGVAEVTPVPDIPTAVMKAVQALGGWGGLAEAHPSFWGQRYKQFQDLYHEESTSLRVDCGSL